MAVHDISGATDYIGGKPIPGNVMYVDSLGRWTQATVLSPGTHYVALVTQASTSAPVATVQSNTLGGTPVWARSSQGVYTLTLAGAFPAAQTAWSAVNADQNVIGITRTSDDVLTFTLGDDGIMNASITISVWG